MLEVSRVVLVIGHKYLLRLMGTILHQVAVLKKKRLNVAELFRLCKWYKRVWTNITISVSYLRLRWSWSTTVGISTFIFSHVFRRDHVLWRQWFCPSGAQRRPFFKSWHSLFKGIKADVNMILISSNNYHWYFLSMRWYHYYSTITTRVGINFSWNGKKIQLCRPTAFHFEAVSQTEF